MALTPKQEMFCQGIVSGLSAKDSYISAYDTKGNENTVYAESSKLMLREDIQNRIITLRKPQEQAIQLENVNARKQQINFINERIAICREKEDESSIIRYTEMLNKIYALYKDNEQEEVKSNNLGKLDTNTLKRLSGAS